MKRLQAGLLGLLAGALLAGCLKSGDKLLCTADEDCEEGRRCELVSGLCVPQLEPPSFSEGGISGAFECQLPNATPGTRVPGIASVVLRPPEADPACAGGPAGQLFGLEAGCTVLRERQPRVRGGGEDPTFFVLRFDQIEADPSSPLIRLALYVRVDAAAVGTLSAPAEVTVQYFERCSRQDQTELRLRFVSTQGTLQITSLEEDRVEGRFDLDLAALSGGRDFGEVCALPRGCEGGDCALVEQSTDRCQSGACFPDPREPNPTEGFCSGRCESHIECGYDAEEAPDAYCLIPPGRPQGQCIRLCDPERAACPAGTSCRPSTDFEEFPGGVGPARCLDECFATDSTPAATGCSGAVPDAGVRPDAGRPPVDGGTPDSGPPDAGLEDAGPTDAGTSPLGQACSTGSPCPSPWICAQASPGPLGTEGFCTRGCAGDAVCEMGYAGPGQATCRPAVRDLATTMVVNPACIILCGADFGQDGNCPGVMTCGDIIDNTTRMPGADGRPDVCVE